MEDQFVDAQGNPIDMAALPQTMGEAQAQPLPVVPAASPMMASVVPPTPQADPGAALAPRVLPSVRKARQPRAETPRAPRPESTQQQLGRATEDAARASKLAEDALAKKGEIDKRLAEVASRNADEVQAVNAAHVQKQTEADDRISARTAAATAAHSEAVSARKDAIARGDRSMWDDMSTWNKVLAGIGLALGSFAATGRATGGKNQSLDIIMGALDRDAEQKRRRIETTADRAKETGADLGHVEQWRRDEYANIDSSREAGLGAAADRLTSERTKLGVPQTEIATSADIAALRAEEAKARQTRLDKIAADETDNEFKRQQLGIQRAGLGIDREKLGIERAKAAADGGPGAPKAPIYIDGKLVGDLGKGRETEAKDLRERIGASDALLKLTDQLRQNVKTYGAKEVGGKGATERSSLIAGIVMKVKGYEKLGQVTDSDRALVTDQLGLDTWDDDTALTGVDAYAERQRGDRATMLQSVGVNMAGGGDKSATYRSVMDDQNAPPALRAKAKLWLDQNAQ